MCSCSRDRHIGFTDYVIQIGKTEIILPHLVAWIETRSMLRITLSFAVNAWGPFGISYDQNQENGCVEKYICVPAFKHRTIPIDQVFCTRCMLCLLQSWRFLLKRCPGKPCKAPKTHSRLPLSCVLSNMHTFTLTQMRKCV